MAGLQVSLRRPESLRRKPHLRGQPIQNGQLLSYGDDAIPGNVSDPVIVGNDDWLAFKFLFAGKNLSGENRIYAVNNPKRAVAVLWGRCELPGMFRTR